jgi:hypothetical protein
MGSRAPHSDANAWYDTNAASPRGACCRRLISAWVHSFSGEAAKAVHGACETIGRMPAHFMTYPGSDRPILPNARTG